MLQVPELLVSCLCAGFELVVSCLCAGFELVVLGCWLAGVWWFEGCGLKVAGSGLHVAGLDFYCCCMLVLYAIIIAMVITHKG